MKRVSPMSIIIIGMFLLPSVRPSWAKTYAYIPSYGNDSVVRVDTSDPANAQSFASYTFTDPACSPYGAAVTPDGGTAIVTCKDENAVVFLADTFFSDAPGTPPRVDVGADPRGVAVSPDGKYAFVANFEDDSVSVINIATRMTTTIAAADGIGDGPSGLAAVRSGGAIKVYVTNYNGNSVSVITDDGTAPPQVDTIENIGNNPSGVAAAPDGRRVYIAIYNNGMAGRLRMIDTQDDTLVPTIVATKRGPWGVAVGSRGDYVYVTNSYNSTLDGNSVTVIRTSDNVVVRHLPVGLRPYGVAAPMNADFAYVINQGTESIASSISEVDIRGGSPVTTSISIPDAQSIQTPYALGAFIGGPPPAAPSALEGTATSYDRIDLSWSDNSEDELGFAIERRVTGGAEYEEIARTGPGRTSYSDGVVSQTTYQYRIRAFNETASSGYAESGEITTPEGQFHWCFIGTAAAEVFGAR